MTTAFGQHNTVGFVGVGRMGANMARRLKDCGFRISAVYDINPTVADSIAAELETKSYQSLQQVTAQSDIIITVVTDDAAMRAIYTTPNDNLLLQASGKLFLNCATISPGVHQAVMQMAEQAKAFMLEVPMASSIPQAREGTLYLMCAGQPEVYKQAKVLLDALSKNHRFVGPAGTAAQLKALVNMVMNINTAGLAEGLGLANALGLDLTMVREVFSQTGAHSRVLETDAADMQDREHDTYFSVAHAAKDSGIALDLARDNQLTLPLATATKGQYDQLVKLGLGDLDKSAVAELTFKNRHANASMQPV